ncbi:Protein phosphatase inhibitor [Fragilaria crotonensis]|nr:Protein phosphatase inhibitor [Fragilaria crotonensis]
MSYQSQQQGQHASASFNQADGANVEMTSEAASIPETFAQGGPQLRTQTASATMTITETAVAQHEILQLTLRGTPTVTWDENTLDNEGLGRKSSKRCCIFHKQRAYDESSTDSSDIESDQSESSGASGDRKMPAKKTRGKKIARPKQGKSNIPDSQRFHA